MGKNFAVVFPGQGSQSVGMLCSLARDFPLVQWTFDQASKLLGYDLWYLSQHGPQEELNQTWVTQPALLTASVAIWRLWCQKKLALPMVMAGHSLGEYSALVCAGSLEFDAAVLLVEKRGRLMQEASVGGGGMVAILGLEDEVVCQACHEAQERTGSVVVPANFNAAGQVVISGEGGGIEEAVLLCRAKGARRTVKLAVGIPSHSPLMRPAAEKFALELQKITLREPQIPVINNVDTKIECDPEAIRRALIRQLYSPVRWNQALDHMVQIGVTHMLEFGPGGVLTGLLKRRVAEMTAEVIDSSEALDGLTEMREVG